jgi:peptidoglycan/xylan/chitin deacetylase (PgdA/CDA1 family)
MPATLQAQAARTVAVTLDDGPFVGGGGATYLARAETATTRLLDTLREHRVPAVLLVNEAQIDEAPPAEVAARTALLTRWLDDGHVLGNHTYSHPDANALTADAYAEDIAKGDLVTRRLLASRAAAPSRYFRHPFTHTGDTAEKKAAIEAALTARGYVVTPHTIENSDWLFNVPYRRALEKSDEAEAQRVADAYVAYTRRVVAFAEAASGRVFGREIPQVLLIHANALNADTLTRVLADLTTRGYRFVTLDEVMRDEAYRTPDTWVGRGGPTWLFRWSRSLGKTVTFADEPEPPTWVVDAAK